MIWQATTIRLSDGCDTPFIVRALINLIPSMIKSLHIESGTNQHARKQTTDINKGIIGFRNMILLSHLVITSVKNSAKKIIPKAKPKKAIKK